MQDINILLICKIHSSKGNIQKIKTIQAQKVMNAAIKKTIEFSSSGDYFLGESKYGIYTQRWIDINVYMHKYILHFKNSNTEHGDI